jgi:hypothetical protein
MKGAGRVKSAEEADFMVLRSAGRRDYDYEKDYENSAMAGRTRRR